MIKIIIFLIALLLPVFIYAEELEYDPFDNPFDQPEVVGEGDAFEESVEVKQIDPPQITIEGILAGGKAPAAIIDGDVYRKGDVIGGIDAKVYNIDKDQVTILYQGELFKMGTEKRRSE